MDMSEELVKWMEKLVKVNKGLYQSFATMDGLVNKVHYENVDKDEIAFMCNAVSEDLDYYSETLRVISNYIGMSESDIFLSICPNDYVVDSEVVADLWDVLPEEDRMRYVHMMSEENFKAFMKCMDEKGMWEK